MSLENKFNQNDEGIINKLDDYLLKFHKKIAETWQNKIYRTKSELENSLHTFSSAMFTGNAIINGGKNSYLNATLSAFLGLHQFALSTEFGANKIKENIRGGKELTKIIKFCIIHNYFFGIGSILYGLGNLAGGISTNEIKYFNRSIDALTFGLGYLGMNTALYLERIDIKDPPKRHIKEQLLNRLKDKIREYFPQTQPVPVRYN